MRAWLLLLPAALAGFFEKHDAVILDLGGETLRFRVTEVHASSRKVPRCRGRVVIGRLDDETWHQLHI